jgi:hypothetical protein
MPNGNQESTITELMRVLTAAAGVPMNIDQVMEQLPSWAERSVVSDLLRELKEQGRTTATVEDGRVAYALAERTPPAEDVIHLEGRRAGDRARSTIEKVRDLLREATGPMTPAEVAAAIPDETLEKVQRALHQGKHKGEFDAVRRGPRSKAYACKGGVSVAVNVNTAAPASAPMAPPAPPAARAPAPAPAAAPAPGPKKPISMHPGIDQVIAERAERRTELGRMLDASVNNAEAAREAYVLSVVDLGIYGWLQESVRTARAARDAFAGDAQ